MSEKRHPGITMHKISFGGGFVGLLFAAGSALIFLLGFPTLWYFVASAVVLGLAIAATFAITNRHRTERNQPLSILELPKKAENLAFSRRGKIPNNFRAEHHSAPA